MDTQISATRQRDDRWPAATIGRSVYVARQPILDVDQQVYAYELLFRAGLDDLCCVGVDLNEASRQVVHNAFLTLGVDRLLDGRRAFVNVTADALLSGWVYALPSDSSVIELLETIEVTDAVVDACRGLKQQGFQIALDDFVYQKQWEPVLELADFVKVSFRDTAPDERRHLANWLRPRGARLLAEQVETRDEFDEAVELGYSYFQGYFLFRPEIMAGREIRGFKASSLRLLHEISTPDVSRREVEDLIKRDASLSHKLLRYLNSACFSFRGHIASIRNALLLLGDDNLRRWAALFSIGSVGQDKPQALVVASAVRTRFCEALAPLVGLQHRGPELFLLGLFSLLDALLDQPMSAALEPMHLSPDLNHALEGGASELRAVLDLVVAYERADWREVSAAARHIEVPTQDVPQLYLGAVEWAAELFGV
ncbi:MAG: HDOD domain-containing protein [Vicinamibacterales bacterium]|jgi:EAL and modified HD-GYP domain-containing signal transduction protein|nr:HDOD domain-containing protein [Vicinamibacterales bacterium]HJN44462.1 HDOD domain-containing protein [Vicinamibacterales bacterium]